MTLRPLVAAVREEIADVASARTVTDAEIVRHIGNAAQALANAGIGASVRERWQDDITDEAVRRIRTGEIA